MGCAGTDNDRDVALRCRVLTRLYAQSNSKQFAEEIGISPTRWNGIENKGALSKDVARRIWRKWPEVSLDWLWRGRDDALTPARSNELLAIYRAVEAEFRTAGKAKGEPKRKRRAS